MNRQKIILVVVVLALIGATAGLLAHARSNQKLGTPGVKTGPISGSYNLEALLPAEIPGYKSEWIQEAAMVTNTLPPDTSYGQRLYTGDDGFQALVNVVLMGSSRASIHKPQICLTAQGWKIDDAVTRVERIQLDRPFPYDLPVMLLVSTKQLEVNGQTVTKQGLYAYWFVDADRYTPQHVQRMLWTARDILLTGVLDRWAYISYFSVCDPGQEAAAFERMKKLIAVSVPEYQLVPNAKTAAANSTH